MSNQNSQFKSPNIAVLAYMDDTLWIADSKKELSNILQTAQSFYSFANILVNLNKSVLATTCSDIACNIEFNNTTIHAINKKESFRFLGCWFTMHKRHKSIHQIILKEITDALIHIKKANITEKQAIYVINSVIFARFSYRIQNTFIKSTTCQATTNRYTAIIKQKAGLAKSIPNLIIWCHLIYNLKTMNDIQTQQLFAL